MKIFVDYPTKEEELEIMRRMSSTSFSDTVSTKLTKDDIFNIRELVNQVSVSASLEEYIVELIFASRHPKDYDLGEIADYIQFGASPRATINMSRAAKAAAFFEGRDYVLPEDIKEVAYDVMNHRIILNYEAEADGVSTHEVLSEILKKVPINK
jgi:MoxR-like ATPase